jgi:hypothetical protein
MPAAMDAGFGRNLPSRWHNPPALGALGHDVRTDVPGGLVTGVARTVDPLDSRPADLVWRMPDLAEPNAGVSEASAAAAVSAAATGRAGAAARPLPYPAVSMPAGVAPLGTSLTTAGGTPSRTAPMSTQQTPAVRDASPVPQAQLQVPSPAERRAENDTGTGAQPSLADGTAQTRQALPEAAAAVEARDPRPVPADVTDGPTAAAPDRGVYADPEPGTSKSPPDAPASGLGTLFTPREARSGSDSQGSAPAVAPLISRNPLRSSAQPLVGGPGPQASATTADSGPAGLDSGAAPNATTASTSAETMTSAAESEGGPRDVPQAAAATESGRDIAQPALPPAADSAQLSSLSAVESAAQSATRSIAQSPTAQSTVTTPEVGRPASPSSPVRTAPIVSATRFAPLAAPISVLQPPAAPVDQPVREAESVIGSYATAAIGSATQLPAAAPSAAPSGPQMTRAATATALSSAQAVSGFMSRSAGQTAAQSRDAVGRALSEARAVADSVLPDQEAAGRAGRSVPLNATGAMNGPVPGPAATATAAAPHDPAALDALARQLYGRFSRHLAGELLVDRERSQFLTDLH